MIKRLPNKQVMTSVVDMRYTLFAPTPTYYSDIKEDCSSSVENIGQFIELENDPVLSGAISVHEDLRSNRMSEVMRMSSVDSYEDMDLDCFWNFKNKLFTDDFCIFPELSSSSEGTSLDIDIDSELESIDGFGCCCSAQCKECETMSDTASDVASLSPSRTVSLPSSPPIETRTENQAIKQEIFIKQKPQEYAKVEEEEDNYSNCIVPSPTRSEDESLSDCNCGENDIKLPRKRKRSVSSSSKSKLKKRSRLNSLCSDSDESIDYYREAPRHVNVSIPKKKPTPVTSVEHKVSRAKQLYQFLVELLKNEDYCPKYIDWVSREERIFKLVDSTAVAQLWGGCKNRENMTYEKMSRALRYYYENGILERVPNIRLHYRFGQVVLDEYGGDL